MSDACIFTRDFVLDAGITLFCVLNYFVLLINITRYSEVEFGADPTMGGLAAGIYVIGGLLSRITIGKYIELVGRKKMLIAGISFALLMSAMYFFISSFIMLTAVRFLHGMAYGITSTCSSDIAAKLVPPERRGEGIGYYGLCFTLASAVGPLLGMSLGADESYEDVFIIGTLMYLLAFILALAIRVPEETLNEEQKAEARSFSVRNLFEVSAIPLSVASMVFYFSYSGVLSFISSYSKEIGLSSASMFFFVAVSLGTLVSRLNAGKIYDKKGPNSVMIPAFVVFVCGMALYSVSRSPVPFLFSGFLIGVSIAIVFSTLQSVVVSLSPPRRYGVTTSTFSAFNDIGTGIGPIVLGAIITASGYSTMYLLCASIAVGSMAMYWTMYGRTNGNKPGMSIESGRVRWCWGRDLNARTTKDRILSPASLA